MKIKWRAEIGFTGTRNGMTQPQKANLAMFLKFEKRGLEPNFLRFRHGDCVGADVQADKIARQQNYKISIHPPINPRIRAYCKPSCPAQEHDPKPYLKRNKDIVNECEILIAAPDNSEHTHSGTWSTVRYARKKGKPIIIIYPNGEMNLENL